MLTETFDLQARDLGLLAGGYFLGFAVTQLPLGNWLDRHGPRRVILGFLTLAVAGCLAFSVADSFAALLASRVLMGMGLSACLMAPLTGYRRWFAPATLLRANSWMLMTGSLGMLASTLPVHWLMPVTGWRALFWGLAAMLVVCMALIRWQVPAWSALPSPVQASPDAASGYADIWRHPAFRRLVPMAFFNYGGLIAVQALWAGPWMVRVAGYSPLQSATGLFCINASMLVAFWSWGMVNPWLNRHGWHAHRLLARGVPVSLAVLAANIVLGPSAGWPAWALFCVACSVLGLSQPAVGMAFGVALAGRAMSAYNLVIFSGVFAVQWGIGLAIDGFLAAGLTEALSFRAAMAVFFCCSLASYGYFMRMNAHNSTQ